MLQLLIISNIQQKILGFILVSGIVILISGRGSNLEAMCNAGLSKHIKCVISNKDNVLGLEVAKRFGITTNVLDHKKFPNREEFDKQLANIIDTHTPQYIILAGFMRILSPWFVNYYKYKLVNIHPSLLPAFIGSNAIEQAFNSNVKITGVTIHFVTDQLDQGPIIAQGVVPANNSKSIEELAESIHKIEHVIYPFIVDKLINNKVVIGKHDLITIAKDDKDSNILGRYFNRIFY